MAKELKQRQRNKAEQSVEVDGKENDMSGKKEPKRWVTVAGKHFPIYEDENGNEIFGVGQEKAPEVKTSDLPDEVRRTYSRFIDDHSHDNQLDSDEKAWVEALRKEKYGDKTAPPKEEKVKPWSKAEEKRSVEMSKFINSKLRVSQEFGEFYEENPVEEYEATPLRFPGYKDDAISVTKMNLIYAQNWDENDNRVKQGKAVTGSTYYVVQTDDGSIDETNFAYKTKADAQHAMQLYIEELTRFRNKEKK